MSHLSFTNAIRKKISNTHLAIKRRCNPHLISTYCITDRFKTQAYRQTMHIPISKLDLGGNRTFTGLGFEEGNANGR